MAYEHIPIRPRKNLAPRFPTYYPGKGDKTLHPKSAIFRIRFIVYGLILTCIFLFFYSIPIKPEQLSSYSFSTPFSSLSSTSPPALESLPTIHYLLPPQTIVRDLAYCSTLCEQHEWDEDRYFATKTAQKISEDVFGNQVNYVDSYPKDWPYLIRNTDQFALNSIVSLRMSHLSQSQGPSLTTLESADFIYVALDTRQIARCFGGCRGQSTIPDLDRKAFRIETVDWLMETITSLKNRRSYPSLILALSLIDHDYEYNILTEKSQEIIRDDLIVLGIERNPWTTHDTLKYFEQVPYPSTLHLPTHDTIEAENEAKKKLSKWAQERERIYLLSFAGRSQPILNNSGKGVLNGFAIRTLLADQLAESTATDLHLHYFTATSPRTANSLALIHTAMSKATFCLQPPGDSPTRRGVYESILLGCIPVLFRKGGYKVWSENGIGRGERRKFPSLEQDLSIFISEDVLLESQSLQEPSSSTNNIVSILRNWNPRDIERIRKNMREVMIWMQYSMPPSDKEHWLEEGKWSEDGFGMILRRLKGIRDRGGES